MPEDQLFEDPQAEILWLQKEINRREMTLYVVAHNTVKRVRGPARLHRCVDCGDRAVDWSYDNRAADERSDAYSRRAYSLNPDHYEPRCRSCHTVFDALEARVRSLLGKGMSMLVARLSTDRRLTEHFINVHLRHLDPSLIQMFRDQVCWATIPVTAENASARAATPHGPGASSRATATRPPAQIETHHGHVTK
jgi:hypothetical protein